MFFPAWARSRSSPGHDFGATLHDDAHDAFMTLPLYTGTREDGGQPVVSRARGKPTQQIPLKLHDLIGASPQTRLLAERSLLKEL